MNKSPLLLALIALAGIGLTGTAFAAEGWEQPAVGLIDVLEGGLVKIGAVLIGIGIVAVGLWAAVTARMDWNKFAYVLIGGVLVMAGPTMVKTLLNTVGS